MYKIMYNVFSTVAMVILTLIAVSIITYCVRKIKKGVDIRPK